MRRILKNQGVKLGKTSTKRLNRTLPSYVLVGLTQLSQKGKAYKYGHWVVIKDGILYDCNKRRPLKLKGNPLIDYPDKTQYISSYARVI